MSNCFNQLVDLLCEINNKPTSLGQWARRKAVGGLGTVAKLGVKAAGFAAGVPISSFGAGKKIQAGKEVLNEIERNKREYGVAPCISPAVDFYIKQAVLSGVLKGITDEKKTQRKKTLSALRFYISTIVSVHTYTTSSGVVKRHNLNTFTVSDMYSSSGPVMKHLIKMLEKEDFLLSRDVTVSNFLYLIEMLYTSFEGDDIQEIRNSARSTTTP